MKAVHPTKIIALCALVAIPLSSMVTGPGRAAAEAVEPQSAGSLDPSFGSGGKLLTNFGDNVVAQGNAMAIQPDGKIVVAGGISGTSASTFALARYNSDGRIDSNFGAGGKVTMAFPQGASGAFAIALQQDGRIVAAGDVGVGANHGVMAVARYNTDGTLDASFGAGGETTVDFGAGLHRAYAIAIQPDLKIVLGGTALFMPPDFVTQQFGLARLNPNGTLDPNFGNGGTVTGPSIGALNLLKGLAMQPDGKIVASGYSGATPSSEDWTIVRYNSNGTLDAGFGMGGAATTDFFGQRSIAESVLVLADGKLLVSGFAVQANYNFALARYNVDGTLDPSFGTGGKVTTAFPGGTAFAAGAAVQRDGKILLTGTFQANLNDSKTADFALARYTADGSLDQGFGTGGLVTTDFNGLQDEAVAVAVQPDGNIVVVGEAQITPTPNPTFDFALARYLGGSASFSLALAQSAVTADRGTKVKIAISINRAAGFTGNVTITPPDSAQGVRFKPPDPIATTDSSVAYKLKVSASAPTGPQQLTFTGRSDDGQVSATTLTLNIQ